MRGRWGMENVTEAGATEPQPEILALFGQLSEAKQEAVMVIARRLAEGVQESAGNEVPLSGGSYVQ